MPAPPRASSGQSPPKKPIQQPWASPASGFVLALLSVGAHPPSRALPATCSRCGPPRRGPGQGAGPAAPSPLQGTIRRRGQSGASRLIALDFVRTPCGLNSRPRPPMIVTSRPGRTSGWLPHGVSERPDRAQPPARRAETIDDRSLCPSANPLGRGPEWSPPRSVRPVRNRSQTYSGPSALIVQTNSVKPAPGLVVHPSRLRGAKHRAPSRGLTNLRPRSRIERRELPGGPPRGPKGDGHNLNSHLRPRGTSQLTTQAITESPPKHEQDGVKQETKHGLNLGMALKLTMESSRRVAGQHLLFLITFFSVKSSTKSRLSTRPRKLP